MPTKLPFDAFDYYVSLGPGRSYQAVADKYKVSKRAVVELAKKDDWQRQVLTLEAKARESANKKTLETLEEMCDRHLKQLRIIQVKALETLKALPLASAMDAVRALGMCMKDERVIRGEPGDRTALTIEDTIKREYERWMMPATGEGATDDDGQDGDAE